jgi:uncharacterized protein (TIGR02597 family)
MKSLLQHLSFLSALSLSLLPAALPAATSDPVGAMTVTLTEGADNFIAIPFTSAPSYQGAVASLANTSGDVYALGLGSTVAGADADAWAGLYYVRFTSGAADGKYFTILSSSTTALDIDSLGDDLSGVQAGDTFSVFEYYTLSSLLPPATQTSVVASTGTRVSQRGSEVLFPETTDVGINRAPRLKYFVTSTDWYDASTRGIAEDVILYPDSYIIIRQKEGAGSRDLVLYGSVPMAASTSYVFQSSIKNDNHLAYIRPIPTALSTIGFGSEFLDSSSTRVSARTDELLLWDNPSGINPAPDKKFFKVGGVWYDATTRNVADDYEIKPGAALILRKSPDSVETTSNWKNIPTY